MPGGVQALAVSRYAIITLIDDTTTTPDSPNNCVSSGGNGRNCSPWICQVTARTRNEPTGGKPLYLRFQKPAQQPDDSSVLKQPHYDLISIHEMQIPGIKVIYKSLIFCQIHVSLV